MLDDSISPATDTSPQSQVVARRVLPNPPAGTGSHLWDADRLVRELRIHQMELERQNDELRRTHTELERAHDRFMHLYNASPLPYLTIGADGVIREASQMVVTFLGVEHAKLVGVTLSSFVSVESQTAYYLHVRQVLQTGELDVCEINLSLSNGSLVLARLNSILDKGTEEADSQWITMIQDITNQVLTTESPIGIFRTDTHGAFRYANPKWSEITGVSLEESLGNRWLRALHPDDRERITDAWATSVTRRAVFRAEFRFVNPLNRSVTWVLGQASQELDAGAQLRGFTGTITDITDLKEAEEHLRENANLLGKAQSIAHLGSWDLAVDKSGMTWSNELYLIFGLTPKQSPATYEEFLDRIHPEDRSRVIQEMQRTLFNPGHLYRSEHRVMHRDGSIRMVLEQGELIRNELGQPLHMIGATQDVTEARQIERTLFEHVERFKSLFECSSLGIGIASPDGNLLQTNTALGKFLGYEEAELQGKNLSDFIHPEDREATRWELKDLIERMIPVEKMEKRYLRKDGQVVWCHASLSVVRNAEGHPIFIFTMLKDITHKKEMEYNLYHMKEEVEIRERQRLASTIHDGAIQMLQAVLLNAKSMTVDVQHKQTLQPETMHATCRDITNVIKQLRDLSTDLHPSFLDRMDLGEAIRWMCEKLAKQSKVVLRVDVDGEVGTLEEKLKRNAYFIFQEAATNAIKHAQCSQIDILLRKSSKAILYMQISDNGQGFDWEEMNKSFKGIGLSIIQERTARMNGDVEFFSTPGRGTSIIIRIPLHD
ncbi:MAG: PAS domain S-box protein [Magnetococcus sp. YQC-5]